MKAMATPGSPLCEISSSVLYSRALSVVLLMSEMPNKLLLLLLVPPTPISCSSLRDGAEVLLLLDGPVVVNHERDGNQACFCIDLYGVDNVLVSLE